MRPRLCFLVLPLLLLLLLGGCGNKGDLVLPPAPADDAAAGP